MVTVLKEQYYCPSSLPNSEKKGERERVYIVFSKSHSSLAPEPATLVTVLRFLSQGLLSWDVHFWASVWLDSWTPGKAFFLIHYSACFQRRWAYDSQWTGWEGLFPVDMGTIHLLTQGSECDSKSPPLAIRILDFLLFGLKIYTGNHFAMLSA